MGLLNKTVIIRWNSRNKKWYESKGYVFTKMGEEFEISVDDLPNGSHTSVDCKCDGCEKYLTNIKWQYYKKQVKEDGKYYCKKCAMKVYGTENYRLSRLKNGKSFYQWCYDNISKDELNKILLRWDYDLNIKNGNVLTPKDVSYSSLGFNRKGYWFKCLDHPEHESELKSINNYTRGNRKINCTQCNSIANTHPHLIKLLVNKEDALKYSVWTRVKLLTKCPDCGYEKDISISNYINHGFGCPRCSDGIPYPEKFMLSILEQLLDKDFQVQLNKTTFKWCDTYIYDFYIGRVNCIIETHGLQHYEKEHGNWDSLHSIQQNDDNKEHVAKHNGIENYIIIDCRKSELEWIKNSVMNRNPTRPNQPSLAELLNFNEKDVDWLKCHEYACSSLVKTVCDLWNSGIKDTLIIANILKTHRATITKYLKQGTELSWCIPPYCPNKCKFKQVMCLTTGQIWESQTEAGKQYNMSTSSISACCKGKANYAGKHPITNEPLKWQYYDEYIKSNPIPHTYNDQEIKIS